MICRVNLFIVGFILRITSVSPIAEIDPDEGKREFKILILLYTSVKIFIFILFYVLVKPSTKNWETHVK